MIDRRRLLQIAGASVLLPALPRTALAAFSPQPGTWRRFAVTTTVEVPAADGPAQAWVPVPVVDEDSWMRPGETTWTSTAKHAERGIDPESGAAFIHAAWEAGTGPRLLKVTSVVETQDRAKDFADTGATLSEADRALYTAATELLPTDGIVKDTAQAIVTGIDAPLDRARAIYDWIVVNTARNPETRGCGLGDIASMLQMGDLTGKCADLNALFVGLARAADLPARDVYGLRVAPSAFGYKSLGAGSEDVTGAQHCRAEVFVEGIGWIPADPADVRKVMLEEPPKDLALDDPKVADARATLFGAWEGNWIGWNFAHDVVLPGASDAPLPFLMYPQVQSDGVMMDPLDKETRTYTITARELA
jgi:transglutaminase-like putative cysteine protease